jgi:hypothetical protein
MGWLIWAAAAAALGGSSAQCYRNRSIDLAVTLALGAAGSGMMALAGVWLGF